ncbi:MAG TPA: hypothetical protein VGP68_10120 [Gemmataceae bacterium]|jgi:hypothetical protein|nr:hypothetical protein [Gemmataceae bacterium]
MKAKHFWLASVLVAASALSATAARASDEIIPSVSGEGCTNCGSGSSYHIGANLHLFHWGSSCAACGDHAWFSWRPGQVVSTLQAEASAKIHAIGDCIHSPTCAGAKNAQPIQPQYMYNPYVRSPRDYFMNDR